MDNFAGQSAGAIGPFKPTGYLSQADLYKQAGTMSAIGGVGQIAQAGISFLMGGVEKQQAKNQASQIQLQAEQRSNQLLAGFNKAIGTANYGAARRGVKVGEGSALKNIELSAKDLGTDLSRSRTNANMKASSVKAQGRINYGNSLAQSFGTAGSGFMSLQRGNQYRKQGRDLENM
jgi:hypothetical protein